MTFVMVSFVLVFLGGVIIGAVMALYYVSAEFGAEETPKEVSPEVRSYWK